MTAGRMLVVAVALLVGCADAGLPTPQNSECDALLANPAEAWILCIAPPAPAFASEPMVDQAGLRAAQDARRRRLERPPPPR